MKGQVDRDRTTGRLIERALRPGGESVSTISCPDAETLAAWIAGGLGPVEQNRTETHVADCARCQAQLAAMARMPSALPTAVPRWRLNGILTWLAPLAVGAAAVAIVVWFQRTSPQQLPSKIVPPGVASPMTAPQPVQPSIGSAASADGLERPADAGSRPSNKTVKDRRLAGSDGVLNEGRVPSASSPAVPPRRESDRPLDALTESVQTQTQPPPPPPSERPKSVVARSGAAGELARTTTFAAQSSAIIIEIASPDRAIRWRITQGTLVQRSTDAGSTWETQSTGNAAQLTAGASPAPSVCWLVGRAGVVLLTNDGASWHRLKFPEAVDLIAVSATDADTASVTAADGRVFTTQDGGTTWTAPAPREFSTITSIRSIGAPRSTTARPNRSAC